MDQSRASKIKQELRQIFAKYGYQYTNITTYTNLNHQTLSLWMQGRLSPQLNLGIAQTVEGFIDQFLSVKQRLPTTNLNKLKFLKHPNDFLSTTPQTIDSNQGFGSLIPISIDTQIDGHLFKERFCYDRQEPYLTPQIFAKIITEQINVPEALSRQITDEIQKEINNFKQFNPVKGEVIKVIKINVRVDGYILRDQFEWDINNPQNSPQEFAACLCADMGIGSQFVPPVAHQIRQQVYNFQKRLMSEKKVYGDNYHGPKSMIRDPTEFPQNTYSTSYSNMKDVRWAPFVYELSEGQIKKIESQEKRSARAEKRRRND